MKDKIIDVSELHATFAWLSDGDIGAYIGQDGRTSLADLERRLANQADLSDREYLIVEIAAKRFAASRKDAGYSDVHLGTGGWICDTKSVATSMLRFLRSAAKTAKSERPWPAWALEAKAAGWTPPKNWCP